MRRDRRFRKPSDRRAPLAPNKVDESVLAALDALAGQCRIGRSDLLARTALFVHGLVSEEYSVEQDGRVSATIDAEVAAYLRLLEKRLDDEGLSRPLQVISASGGIASVLETLTRRVVSLKGGGELRPGDAASRSDSPVARAGEYPP